MMQTSTITGGKFAHSGVSIEKLADVILRQALLIQLRPVQEVLSADFLRLGGKLNFSKLILAPNIN